MKKLLALSLLSLVVLTACGTKKISEDEVIEKAQTFINETLMTDGSTVTVENVTTEFGLYKFSVNLSAGNIVESYMSKDGLKFFPQAMDMEINNEVSSSKSNPVDVNIPKRDDVTVELFVMSHCPYGTQIEKGMLPVIEALGDEIDFELKFVNYAMHGEIELQEQMVQYCIQKDSPEKFNNYLSCFLEDGTSAPCLNSNNISSSDIESCVSKTDKEFDVMENFNNKIGWKGSYPGFQLHAEDNIKYGVGGSPTLIINETKISSDRDSASLLNSICAGFNNPPKECDTVLSSASPSPGFGYEQASGKTTATCN